MSTSSVLALALFQTFAGTAAKSIVVTAVALDKSGMALASTSHGPEYEMGPRPLFALLPRERPVATLRIHIAVPAERKSVTVLNVPFRRYAPKVEILWSQTPDPKRATPVGLGKSGYDLWFNLEDGLPANVYIWTRSDGKLTDWNCVTICPPDKGEKMMVDLSRLRMLGITRTRPLIWIDPTLPKGG